MLLSTLDARCASPLNIAATAEELGYGRRAFDLRLDRLVSTLGAHWCPRREDDHRVPGAQAKLYLTDPLLSWLPSRLRAGLPAPDMTRLTEASIGVALARAIDDVEEGRWLGGDTIGYARTSAGNEVDLAPVALAGPGGAATSTPIECKWVDDRWRAAARTIDGKYHRGILATKSTLHTDDAVWAVPAPLLALLLL